METEITTGEVYTGPLTPQISCGVQSRYCACGHVPQQNELVRTATQDNAKTSIVRCVSCGLGKRPPKVHGRKEVD